MLSQKHEHFQRTLALQNQDDLSLSSTTTSTESTIYLHDDGSISHEDIRALDRLWSQAMVPLRELEIGGEICYSQRIAPLLLYLTSLTALRIYLNDRFDVQLDSLFAALPLLERLDLRTLGSITVSATTAITNASDNQDVEATTAMAKPTGRGRKATAMRLPLLRSLILENSRVYQVEREGFLTRTPHL